jgi:alpha-amylase
MSARRASALALSSVFLASLAAVPAAAAGQAESGRFRALHSLRSPVTDERFYFVMADRFEKGDTGNDRGGLTGDRLVTGFDPSSARTRGTATSSAWTTCSPSTPGSSTA